MDLALATTKSPRRPLVNVSNGAGDVYSNDCIQTERQSTVSPTDHVSRATSSTVCSTRPPSLRVPSDDSDAEAVPLTLHGLRLLVRSEKGRRFVRSTFKAWRREKHTDYFYRLRAERDKELHDIQSLRARRRQEHNEQRAREHEKERALFLTAPAPRRIVPASASWRQPKALTKSQPCAPL